MLKIRSLGTVLAALAVAASAHAAVVPTSSSVPRGAFADETPTATPSSTASSAETPADAPAAMPPSMPSFAEMLRALDLGFAPPGLVPSGAPEQPAGIPDVGVQEVPEPGALGLAGLALAITGIASRRARRHTR